MYKLAINRPITTLMGVMVFIVFGIMSYKSMPINLFPNVDFPIVTVQTAYYGADPETVESKVTDKIEEVISGIDGIDKLMSTSYEGLSVVTIQFELSKNLDEAVNDVRDKIGGVNLSKEVEKPIVKKLGATGGVINLFIATKSGNIADLMRLADERIKPKLQRVVGVGEVDIIGFREREIRIFAEPFLLNKYNISARELQNIIASENIKAGGGKIVGETSEFILKTRGDVQSIEELKNINIISGIKLKDVARVEDGLSDAKSYSSLNGKEGVMLEVKKISGANTLEIINGVKEKMSEIEKITGENYTLQLLQDQSEKIMRNIDNVTFDLIYGAILAVIIVFFFLRNFTATFVSALAIPTSIIGTFAIIDWLGYDLNRLTLIGLTLAIGIFIDDAIVVIENISKKLEKGANTFEASYEGIKEISFSILAISSMLLAVFVPVAFMGGIVGMFFNSFAMTVVSGIIISYFVAVMFVPSVSARVLSKKESKFYHFTEPFFKLMDRVYVAILKPLIRFKILTILATIGFLFASTTLLKEIGGDFVPMQDNSEFQIFIKAPLGINLETMKSKLEPITKELEKDNRVKYSVLSIGYTSAKEMNKARVYVKILPVEQRKERQEEIVQEYREKFNKIANLSIAVDEVSPFDTGGSNAPIQIVITGYSFDELSKISKKVIKLLEDKKGAVNIDSDFEEGKPEVKITILRENAKRVGVSVEEIAGVLGAAYSSESAISNYADGGREFDITLRFSDEFRKDVQDLKKLQVKTKSGKFVSLDGLIQFKETTSTASINRFDRERKIMITSNIFGETLDNVVGYVKENIKEILPSGYNYRFIGDAENMEDTGKAFGLAVMLAVILIYLILAGLYESLIQPFIIMISMPLSFTGVVLALYLSGNPFSLFVMIGIILLLGMVGKNAILVVDFANQAIKSGKSVDEALIEAGEKRLRPILMTTFAMIGAMIPLAFGGGAGHEANAPMALAIIGGLISSTILTLLVVPAIYKLFFPFDRWLRKFYERGKVE